MFVVMAVAVFIIDSAYEVVAWAGSRAWEVKAKLQPVWPEGLFRVKEEPKSRLFPALEKGVKGRVVPWVVALLDFFLSFTIEDIVSFIILVVIAICLGYAVKRLLRKRVKKALYYFRGIQYEALIEGSTPKEQKEPDYQLEVVSIGLFSTTHVGHGVRVGNFLAVPKHVLTAVEGQLGLRKGKTQYVIEKAGLESKVLRDLYYLMVKPDVFSKLGVSTAPKAGKANAISVSITSRGVGTVGALRPSGTRGVMMYNGSTEAGYSGAAYFDATRWYGLHAGAATLSNCGLSALVIETEAEYLMRLESNREDLADWYAMKNDPNNWIEGVQDWVKDSYMSKKEERAMEDYNELLVHGGDAHELDRARTRLKQARAAPKGKYDYYKARQELLDQGHTLWADEVDYENASTDELRKAQQQMERVSNLVEAKLLSIKTRQKQRELVLEAQGQAGSVKSVEIGPADPTLVRLLNVENKVDRLAKRVEDLERSKGKTTFSQALKGLSQTLKEPEAQAGTSAGKATEKSVEKTTEKEKKALVKVGEGPLYRECACGFKLDVGQSESRMKRLKHMDVHVRGCKKIKPESAWSSDFQKAVKTGKQPNFLGKRSGQKNMRQLPKTSRSEDTKDPFMALVESQSRMESLMATFLETWKPVLQRMDGQVSATTRK